MFVNQTFAYEEIRPSRLSKFKMYNFLRLQTFITVTCCLYSYMFATHAEQIILYFHIGFRGPRCKKKALSSLFLLLLLLAAFICCCCYCCCCCCCCRLLSFSVAVVVAAPVFNASIAFYEFKSCCCSCCSCCCCCSCCSWDTLELDFSRWRV